MGIKRGACRDRTNRAGEEKKVDHVMDSTIPLLLFLFFAGQLHAGADAHPIYGPELGDFKALLERLEDKLDEEERESGPSQGFNEPSEEMAGDAPQMPSSWDGEYTRPQNEGAFGHSNWHSSERAAAGVKNKLGALFSLPRSMQRSSNCFGHRLDRVGSTSGLGCNRTRN